MTSTGRSCGRNRIRAASAAAIALTLGAGACGSSDPEPLTSAQIPAAITGAIQDVGRGHIDDARAEFERVLETDPTNEYALYNLGYLAQIRKDRAEAERLYRATLESDPTFTPALYNLAMMVAGDDVAQAIDLYRRAIASDGQDPNPRLNLGRLLRQAGETAEGNEQIRRAVELNPALRPQAEAEGVVIK